MIHPVLSRTFGGLSRSYLGPQLHFGLIFSRMILFAFAHGTKPATMQASLVFMLVVNTLPRFADRPTEQLVRFRDWWQANAQRISEQPDLV